MFRFPVKVSIKIQLQEVHIQHVHVHVVHVPYLLDYTPPLFAS